MTVTKVRGEIAHATKNHIVSKAEVGRMIAAAGPSVSNSEGKAIGDLYDRVKGEAIRWGQPGEPPRLRFGKGAEAPMLAFFAARNLPYGEGKEAVLSRVMKALEQAPLGDLALAKAPRLTSLHEVDIPYPEHVADFPNRTAYYDAKKDQFFLHETGGFFFAHEAWYGPVSLEGVPVGVYESTKARIRARFDELHNVADFRWTDSFQPPQDIGIAEAILPIKPGDQGVLTALIPSGSEISSKEPDANKPTEFWIKRENWSIGVTQFAGPFLMTEGGAQ